MCVAVVKSLRHVEDFLFSDVVFIRTQMISKATDCCFGLMRAAFLPKKEVFVSLLVPTKLEIR